MYNDEMSETQRAPRISKQVWACDCRTAVDGRFDMVQPNQDGTCPSCGYYAVKVFEWVLTKYSQIRKEESVVTTGFKAKRGGQNNPGIKEKVWELWGKGRTLAEIGRELDVSANAIRYYVKGKGNK